MLSQNDETVTLRDLEHLLGEGHELARASAALLAQIGHHCLIVYQEQNRLVFHVHRQLLACQENCFHLQQVDVQLCLLRGPGAAEQ